MSDYASSSEVEEVDLLELHRKQNPYPSSKRSVQRQNNLWTTINSGVGDEIVVPAAKTKGMQPVSTGFVRVQQHHQHPSSLVQTAANAPVDYPASFASLAPPAKSKVIVCEPTDASWCNRFISKCWGGKRVFGLITNFSAPLYEVSIILNILPF
jgi:hypothetical protein